MYVQQPFTSILVLTNTKFSHGPVYCVRDNMRVTAVDNDSYEHLRRFFDNAAFP